MAKITADHTVTVSRFEEKDGKQVRAERVTLKPGDDVPVWAADQVDEEYTRERTEGEEGYEPDQTRDELVKIATANRIPVEDGWDKDQLTRAIRLHNEAAASNQSVDWDNFGSGEEETTAPEDANEGDLQTEYKELTGRNPDGRWKADRLHSEVVKARQAKQADGGAG